MSFAGKTTECGFTWGPIEVTRMASDPELGVVVMISSPRERMVVRVTPSGIIRVENTQKLTKSKRNKVVMP